MLLFFSRKVGLQRGNFLIIYNQNQKSKLTKHKRAMAQSPKRIKLSEDEPCSSTISYRSQIGNPEWQKRFRTSWDESTELKTSDVNLYSAPFKHAEVFDFIDDKEFLTALMDELKSIPLQEKASDLFQFHQSDDLKAVDSPCVNSFRYKCIFFPLEYS